MIIIIMCWTLVNTIAVSYALYKLHLIRKGLVSILEAATEYACEKEN